MAEFFESFLKLTPLGIVGNVFSTIALILTFVSYQMKTPKSLLLLQTIATASTCVSFFFLDAYTGMLLNVVCVIRNLVYYYKEKKFFSFFLWPYILAAIMGGLGAMSWDGPHCLLIILALAINTVFLSFNNNQVLRWSILLTSTLILIYDLIVHNYGGAGNEIVAIVSSIIGIFRFSKRLNKA